MSDFSPTQRVELATPLRPESTDEVARLRRSPLADRRILLVESVPWLASFAQRSLARVGAAPLRLAASVRSALYQASHDPTLDGAVVDLLIDGQSGLPVVDALLARKVPVVVLALEGERLDDRYRESVVVVEESELAQLPDRLLEAMGA